MIHNPRIKIPQTLTKGVNTLFNTGYRPKRPEELKFISPFSLFWIDAEKHFSFFGLNVSFFSNSLKETPMKYLVLVPCRILVSSACAPILWTLLMISRLDFLRPMRKQKASTDANSGSLSKAYFLWLWRRVVASKFEISLDLKIWRSILIFYLQWREQVWPLFLDAVLLDARRIGPRHR